jgi:hypothetical protein
MPETVSQKDVPPADPLPASPRSADANAARRPLSHFHNIVSLQSLTISANNPAQRPPPQRLKSHYMERAKEAFWISGEQGLLGAKLSQSE